MTKGIVGLARLGTTLTILHWSAGMNLPAAQVDLPGPAGSGQFGRTVVVLPSGGIVVTDPGFDAPTGIPNVGAVRLYHGVTLAVISSLTGSRTNDQVGSDGIKVLSNGNFVVQSPLWNGARGAVTWGDGLTGVNGEVSAGNSLIGSTPNDRVGVSVAAFSNGNYVVVSSGWDNGTLFDAGAVTWASGATGLSGVVTPGNSLVGGKSNDQVGNRGATILPSGDYVVASRNWDNGAVVDVGAVTWASGTTGLVGLVSAANSLIGSVANDQVGYGGVTVLANGNYVVSSERWNGRRGAATWGSGATGVIGVVSVANSLVGSTPLDSVSGNAGGIKALLNGNYVVESPFWDNGTARDAGAATWGNGMSGVSGIISAGNSLVGSKADDFVGETVTVLSNGAYVVSSFLWNSGVVTGVGAVTWGNGSTGVTGLVSAANSLIGSSLMDQVGAGSGVTALANGNYVVSSSAWDNGGVPDAGAVTWADGATGLTGVVSAANSLVGSNAYDEVGSVTALAGNDGNYVVSSPYWDGNGAVNAGAVTWGSGVHGVRGSISPANSLVGSRNEERIGDQGVTALANGNFVVSSRDWQNGEIVSAGAVTWASGKTGITGVVSLVNSLSGSTDRDRVGAGDFGGGYVIALPNGNYVINSPYWDDGNTMDVGAVTWVDGTRGLTGIVSVANSLIGSRQCDTVGSSLNGDFVLGSIEALPDGNYWVRSSLWDASAAEDVGAVTLGPGRMGLRGVVSPFNSIVGQISGGGRFMSAAYDVAGARLLVTVPSENRIGIFSFPILLTNRLNSRLLTMGSPRDNSGRFYQDYALRKMEERGEWAAFVRSRSRFEPALQLLEGTTLNLIAMKSASPDDRSQCLLLFTNEPGANCELHVSGIDVSQVETYDVGVYPVLRPGYTVPGELDPTDPSSSNRTAAVGIGRWQYDDFLLAGVRTGDRVSIRLEQVTFAPFLEVRLLSDESIQHYIEGETYPLTIQGTGQGSRDYLIRVTSSASGALGSYTLKVERVSATPEIWGFSPSSGLPGTWVTVRGTNFLDGLNPLVTGMRFGGVPGSLTEPVGRTGWQEFDAQVPAEAVSGPIAVVTASAEGSSTNAFTVLAPVGGVRREGSGGISFAVSNAVAGAVNVIEATADLQPPAAWTRMATNVLSPAGVWRYTNGNVGEFSRRFFRARRD